MVVPRVFSTEGVSPFDQVDWELRTAEIKDEKGRAIFQQVDCEIPKAWSQLATNVVASKVFLRRDQHARAGDQRSTTDRPRGPGRFPTGARDDGYFATEADAERFYDELTAPLPQPVRLVQFPVWFQRRPLSSLRPGRPGQQLALGMKRPGAWSRPRVPTSIPRGRPASSRASRMTCKDIMRVATAEAMLFKYARGPGRTSRPCDRAGRS